MLDPSVDTIVFLNFMLAGMIIAALFCSVLAATVDGILLVFAHIAHLIRYLLGREQWLTGLPARPLQRAEQPAEIAQPAMQSPENQMFDGNRQLAESAQHEEQRAEFPHAVGSVRHAESRQCKDGGVAKGSPTATASLPVTQKTLLPVTSGLPVSVAGVARGGHDVGSKATDQSANGWQDAAKATQVGWRPLATPRLASTSPSMLRLPSSSMSLPAPVIPEAQAAMRFRIWLLEFGLEEVDRGYGDLIATIDLWWLAQRFALGNGFRIGSHDRFFEELRQLPGVHKEEDRRVTRLRGARQKRVAYSFRPSLPAIVRARRTASGD